jgi:hypothetical protein
MTLCCSQTPPTLIATTVSTHAQVEAGEEPGLEYDADSEEELDAVGALCTDPSVALQPPLRFKLLHNLWSTGVPRATTMTIARQDSGSSQVMEAAAAAPRMR